MYLRRLQLVSTNRLYGLPGVCTPNHGEMTVSTLVAYSHVDNVRDSRRSNLNGNHTNEHPPRAPTGFLSLPRSLLPELLMRVFGHADQLAAGENGGARTRLERVGFLLRRQRLFSSLEQSRVRAEACPSPLGARIHHANADTTVTKSDHVTHIT